MHSNMEISNFNSLAICSNELGVLLPEYDNSFMSKLTDIYDGHPYSERRRTRELNFKIDNPQINLLAATTPSYLNSILPEGAWDQGFLSRTLLVYASERMTRPVFTEIKMQDDLRATLVTDLKQIFALHGGVKFTPEAAQFIENWNRNGQVPLPEHPKLVHYLTRRLSHFLKLCVVACVSSADDLLVTAEHAMIALNWLSDMEFYLTDIFKAMVVGGDRKAMEETWYFAATQYAKTATPIPEGQLIEFLAQRVPANNVARVLDVMTRAGLLKMVVHAPGNWYEPKSRKVGT